jgi:hypothetical protein
MAEQSQLSIDQRKVLDVLRELPRAAVPLDGNIYALTTQVPPDDQVYETLREGGASLSRHAVKTLLQQLRRMEYTGFIHKGQPPHVWTVTVPDGQPASASSGEEQLSPRTVPAEPSWLKELHGAVQEMNRTLTAADEEISQIWREAQEQKANAARLEAELAKATGERDQAVEEAGRLSQRLTAVQALLNAD